MPKYHANPSPLPPRIDDPLQYPEEKTTPVLERNKRTDLVQGKQEAPTPSPSSAVNRLGSMKIGGTYTLAKQCFYRRTEALYSSDGFLGKQEGGAQ
ncbi:hypothetical protein GUJ93_ZPchr0008g12203 [Zizania palustris]|uniref:Uncharacterized protein n=1 Tax=Zizania palustris TaxID=103762 RepID=A0A8J5V251_ZIZPA|nr:hypothetical protein GUJ93_ZPchr0008g12203 [Zizania palustris]